MEKEYRVSTGSKIFYGISAIAFIGISIFAISTVLKRDIPVAPALFLAVAFFAGAIFFVLKITCKSINIGDEQITVTNALGSKHTYIKDVKGFRLKGKGLVILYLTDDSSKIKVYASDEFADSEQLLIWLDNNLINLDSKEYEAEKTTILQNNELGYTETERNEKLEKAKTKSLIYNIVGGTLFLTCFIKGFDFGVCLITFFYPLVGVFLIITSKGLIRFFTKNNSPLPSIYVGMYIPTIVLMIVTIVSYHVINKSGTWLPFILMASVFILILALKGVNKANGMGQYVLLMIIAVFYSLGSTLFINCGLDTSATETFTAKVLDKHKAKDVPYVLISGWGYYQESNDIKVINSFYNNVQIGSTVHVQLKKGLLNIPWYYITQ